MAIHAKANGMLIAGKIIAEDPLKWIFQAMDRKRPTIVGKGDLDPKNNVFDGPRAVENAMKWQVSIRRKPKK